MNNTRRQENGVTRCEIEMKTDFNELLPAKAENKKDEDGKTCNETTTWE